MERINLRIFNKKDIIILLALCLIMTIPTFSQYEISWYTIDGGGGMSRGGQYSLTGTIGQPDAAYSAGGDYEVLGGFWPGAPLFIVNFEDFARFAQYWLENGSDIPADLYEDNIIDCNDLRLFIDELRTKWNGKPSRNVPVSCWSPRTSSTMLSAKPKSP